jgi:hypothetical protein
VLPSAIELAETRHKSIGKNLINIEKYPYSKA